MAPCCGLLGLGCVGHNATYPSSNMVDVHSLLDQHIHTLAEAIATCHHERSPAVGRLNNGISGTRRTCIIQCMQCAAQYRAFEAEPSTQICSNGRCPRRAEAWNKSQVLVPQWVRQGAPRPWPGAPEPEHSPPSQRCSLHSPRSATRRWD